MPLCMWPGQTCRLILSSWLLLCRLAAPTDSMQQQGGLQAEASRLAPLKEVSRPQACSCTLPCNQATSYDIWLHVECNVSCRSPARS